MIIIYVIIIAWPPSLVKHIFSVVWIFSFGGMMEGDIVIVGRVALPPPTHRDDNTVKIEGPATDHTVIARPIGPWQSPGGMLRLLRFEGKHRTLLPPSFTRGKGLELTFGAWGIGGAYREIATSPVGSSQ